MTAQFREILNFHDDRFDLCSAPLEAFFETDGYPPNLGGSTALERGYVGEWEVVDGKLYLLSLEGEYRENGRGFSIYDVFPDAEGPVFAEWYSGTLRCPLGKMLAYVHMDFESIYERDLFIEVERGVIMSERVQTNQPANLSGSLVAN
jgi:hypothetical protein